MGQGASKVEEQTLQLFFFFSPHFSLARTKRKKLLEGIFFFYLDGGLPQTPYFPGGPTRRGLVTRRCPHHPTPPDRALWVVVLR